MLTAGRRFYTIRWSRDGFVTKLERIVVSEHRDAFVCLAYKIVIKKSRHCAVFALPSVGIVLASVEESLSNKFMTIFACNSKFHIRIDIWCQRRNI